MGMTAWSRWPACRAGLAPCTELPANGAPKMLRTRHRALPEWRKVNPDAIWSLQSTGHGLGALGSWEWRTRSPTTSRFLHLVLRTWPPCTQRPAVALPLLPQVGGRGEARRGPLLPAQRPHPAEPDLRESRSREELLAFLQKTTFRLSVNFQHSEGERTNVHR